MRATNRNNRTTPRKRPLSMALTLALLLALISGLGGLLANTAAAESVPASSHTVTEYFVDEQGNAIDVDGYREPREYTITDGSAFFTLNDTSAGVEPQLALGDYHYVGYFVSDWVFVRAQPAANTAPLIERVIKDEPVIYVYSKLPEPVVVNITEDDFPAKTKAAESSSNVTLPPAGTKIGTQTETAAQPAVVPESAEDIGDYRITNVKQKNGFTIVKHGVDGKPLEGAGFTLYGEDGTTIVIDEQTTALPDAQLAFDDLPVGKYILKETTIPKGYMTLRDKWTIEVVSDKLIRIDDAQGVMSEMPAIYAISNTLITAGFSIEKVGDDGKALIGAGFTLFAEDGETVVREEQFTEEPYARLAFNKLPMGKYILKETTVPTGFHANRESWNIEVVTEKQVMIEDDSGEMIEIISDYRIMNTVQRNGFIIVKVDEEDKPLASAGFTLYKDDGVTEVVGEQRTTLPEAKLEYKNLPAGKYILKETTVPYGFTVSKTCWPIEIISDKLIMISDGNGGMVEMGAEHKIVNARQHGRFTIQKVGDKDEALGGAGFTLFAEDGETVVIDEQTTMLPNAEATFINVPVGKYILKETTLPKGYTAEKVSWKVEVLPDNLVKIESPSCEMVELASGHKIKNTQTRGSFTITKVDDAGHAVAGAGFTLYRENGAPMIMEQFSMLPNGRVSFLNLTAGKYILRETTVPAGHTAIRKEWNIEVVNDQLTLIEDEQGAPIPLTIDFAIANTRHRNGFVIEKVGDSGEPLEGAGFTLYLADGETIVVDEMFTSHESTKLIYRDLPTGKYLLKETTIPEGYKADRTVWEVEIVSDSLVNIN